MPERDTERDLLIGNLSSLIQEERPAQEFPGIGAADVRIPA
ncbi:hypothetical protein ACIGXF_34330 [Streptomyces sp. NPDC053086]